MTQHVDVTYLKRLYEDYIFFARECFRHLKYDSFAPIGPTEEQILTWIATGTDSQQKTFASRRGVLAPRGIGKTTFGTVTYTLWRLFRDPEEKVIVASKSTGNAKDFIREIREWIEKIPFITHLAPIESADRDWRDNTTMFDVGPSKSRGKNPSVRAIGMDGQLESSRASLVIGDDVETEQNTQTLLSRKDLDRRVRQFAAMCTFGKQEIVYFGTYNHEQSVYLELDKRGYVFRTWPLLYPEPTLQILHLAPCLQDDLLANRAHPGDIVFSHRIGPDYVARQQAEGRRYFAMQQMLVANLGDVNLYPLRLEDLIVFPIQRDKAPLTVAWGKTNDRGGSTRIEDIPSLGFDQDGFYAPIMYDNEWAAYTGTRMTIDPSGKGKDKTGYAVVSHLNGILFVKAIGGLDGGYDLPVRQQLAAIAREHRVTEIVVEDNFGAGMFADLFEPDLRKAFIEPCPELPLGWRCHVIPRKTPSLAGFKEERIIKALEPVTASHRLVLHPSAARNQAFQLQYTRITAQRNCLDHDDELDALALNVSLWQQNLNQDPTKSAERQKDHDREQQLRDHYKRCGLPYTKSPRWFSHHQHA